MHFSVSSLGFLSRAVLGEGALFLAVERVVSSAFSQVPKGIKRAGGWAFSGRGGCSRDTSLCSCGSETLCVLW